VETKASMYVDVNKREPVCARAMTLILLVEAGMDFVIMRMKKRETNIVIVDYYYCVSHITRHWVERQRARAAQDK